MGTRLAGGLVGVVFGVTLSWTGMSSPEVLREALLLDNAYLYLFFASAVATSTLGLALLRRARVRAVLTGEPVAWTPAGAAAPPRRGQPDLRRRLGRGRRLPGPDRHAGRPGRAVEPVHDHRRRGRDRARPARRAPQPASAPAGST